MHLRISTELSSPLSAEAEPLLDDLSAELGQRFGSDGRASFGVWPVDDARHIFVLARLNGAAVGCGAVRPLHESIGELKRMYARQRGAGVGRAVLRRLEDEARARGFTQLWLETRRANHEALAFYERAGFEIGENFGRYIGRDECVCLGKTLASDKEDGYS